MPHPFYIFNCYVSSSFYSNTVYFYKSQKNDPLISDNGTKIVSFSSINIHEMFCAYFMLHLEPWEIQN